MSCWAQGHPDAPLNKQKVKCCERAEAGPSQGPALDFALTREEVKGVSGRRAKTDLLLKALDAQKPLYDGTVKDTYSLANFCL